MKDLARKNPENAVLRAKLNKLYKAAFGREATDAHWMMMGLDGHFCREYPVPSIKKLG